jgi:predicted nucleic acid-binding protein
MAAMVIDCSVTMSWGFPDEDNPYAQSVLRALPALSAAVPSLWPLEVANSLLVAERRARLSEADSNRFVTLVGSLPITIDEETSAYAMHQTLALARARNLSAYDASYLELAMRLGLPLATLDQRLRDAAAAVGVQVYTAT